MPFGLALRAIKRDRRKPGQKVITPALTFFLHSWVPEESECWMANAICGFRLALWNSEGQRSWFHRGRWLLILPILLILSKFLVFYDRVLALQRNLFIDLRGLALLPPNFRSICKFATGKSACPQFRQIEKFYKFRCSVRSKSLLSIYPISESKNRGTAFWMVASVQARPQI